MADRAQGWFHGPWFCAQPSLRISLLRLHGYFNCLIVSNVCEQDRNSSKPYLQAMPRTPVSGPVLYSLAHKATLSSIFFSSQIGKV